MNRETQPAGRIFVCINEKAPEKAQCLKGEGEKCLTWIKEEIKKRNLKGSVRASGTRCLGYCQNQGTSIVFEPVHEQYNNVILTDVPVLFENFLKKLNL